MRKTVIFMDIESGGVKPEHPDIQLAAVAIRDWREVGQFEAKIRFDPADCDPKAFEINSYDPKVWEAEAIDEADVVKEFNSFLRRHASLEKISQAGNRYSIARLAGHSIKTFDAPRLQAMFKRNGKDYVPADVYRPLDTLQLCLWHFVGRVDEPKDYKLATVAEALGVPVADAHDALADARVAARVAWRIIA